MDASRRVELGLAFALSWEKVVRSRLTLAERCILVNKV
jgi:hypothetical protein